MQYAPMLYGLTKIAYDEEVTATAFEAHLLYVYELARRLDSEFHRTPEVVCAGKVKVREFLFFDDGSLLIVTLEEGKPIKFEPYIRD